ncbi:MAG TPA: HlyD family efflux transporter periplasmic adaptor subunit [Dehalococcoidia bacterium]|jgi:RND family efflux transporter MFP subunit|nr:HlyD family efflux transporter periplasmic adaptor subunit [Dehalococcoidia bacterium]
MTHMNDHKFLDRGRSRGFAAIKLGVFIAITAVIAVGAYFGAQEFLLNDDTTDEERSPVAVQRGTLLDDVTASGSVSFPELESLRFEISGTVAELLVDEGDEVSEGQPLILLDDVTIAALESAEATAESALKDAGEDLAELLGGATGLERAIAVSNLADARVASMNAAADLAELLGGATGLERAIAVSNLADARVASMNAAADLAEFTSSAGGANSPATVSAKEALADANESLADVLATADDSAQAQAELVTDAEEIFGDAEADYQIQLTGWFGNVVTSGDLDMSPTELLASWGTTVDQIIDDATATNESLVDDLATPWNESIVWVWTHLTPYPILTNCDATSEAFTFRCPSAEIDNAWDAEVAAQEELDEVIDDAAAVAKTQQVLINAAQEVVESAAEDIVGTVNDIDISALAATLAEKIELENELEDTLAALDDLDTLEIKLATVAVNSASTQLDNAKFELAASNLLAPFDGVISSISVEVGDPVNRSTATIDILDPNVVTIEGSVDEIDVLSLRIGDTVAVVLDALPDQTLEGVIEEIGDGVNQQGVIEFPLTILLTPPDEIDLIEGLSATATIVLNQIDNALLIPLQAVSGSFTQPSVDVVNADGFTTTPITLGASDDFWVIVEDGLVEGQQVLMTVAEENADPFAQFFGGGGGAIRIPGGGGGGEIRIPAGGGGRR